MLSPKMIAYLMGINNDFLLIKLVKLIALVLV